MLPTQTRAFRYRTVGALTLIVGGMSMAAWAKSSGRLPWPDMAPKVSTVSLEPSTLVRVYRIPDVESGTHGGTWTGQVQARFETPIAFRVPGKITARNVEVGERVREGQVLFELDAQDFELQRKAALANLEAAAAVRRQTTAEEKRLALLRQSKTVSQSEYDLALSARDTAIGQHQSAQKQLELAENQLQYCRLQADHDGIVTGLAAEAGQVVSIGARLGTIAKTTHLEAVVDIPENRLPENSKVEARVRFWSLPSIDLGARLREQSPVADPVTRTYRAKFALLDPPAQVQLGMTATVVWSSDTSMGTSIPSTSVLERDGKPMVWVLEEDADRRQTRAIRAQAIEIAGITDDRILVASGLQPGMVVVSAGVQKLDDSMRVRAWESPSDD
jgi:RND family efflux transporter MFP subunit